MGVIRCKLVHGQVIIEVTPWAPPGAMKLLTELFVAPFLFLQCYLFS